MLRLLPAPTVILLALLAVTAPGCVSSARHQRVLEELERLRQANLELQRDLAEQRVRLQEMAEARLHEAGRRNPLPEAADPPDSAASLDEPAAGTPASVAPGPGLSPRPSIEEELILDARPDQAVPGQEGERLLWVARRYGRQGSLTASIDAYSRFIKDYPFSPLLPEAFVERARARLKTGDRSGALEDYRTVIEAFPSSPLVGEARREADRLGGS